MRILKKISPLSLAYIFSLISAVLTLLLTILALIFVKIPQLTEQIISLAPAISLYGYWSLLLSSLTSAITGFITGLLVAVLYNLFASLIGGVKIELSESK